MRDNLRWHIEQVILFNEDAKKVSTKNRSRFYKSAYFFLTSCVEMLVFQMAKKYCTAGGLVKLAPAEKYTYKNPHALPQIFQTTPAKPEMVICQRIPNIFSWSDKLTFSQLNTICFDGNLVNKRLFGKIDRVRKGRNRIHLQGLNNKDHHYTKQNVNYVSAVLTEVISIYQRNP